MHAPTRMTQIREVARATWGALKTGTLITADGIITLSLMRKGARPRPGTRTAWPAGLREWLSGEQGRLCVYCRGRLPNASHIDHILPVNQGGTNERENLQLLCPGCNLRKSDRNDAEFRHRYRKLLPQKQGEMPGRRIRQAEFRAVTGTTEDAGSYKGFKKGKYLTASQKVLSGATATGIVTGLGVFLPINKIASPEDASVLLVVSLAVGAAAGAGIWLRARQTGRDQEDDV